MDISMISINDDRSQTRPAQNNENPNATFSIHCRQNSHPGLQFINCVHFTCVISHLPSGRSRRH